MSGLLAKIRTNTLNWKRGKYGCGVSLNDYYNSYYHLSGRLACTWTRDVTVGAVNCLSVCLSASLPPTLNEYYPYFPVRRKPLSIISGLHFIIRLRLGSPRGADRRVSCAPAAPLCGSTAAEHFPPDRDKITTHYRLHSAPRERELIAYLRR